VEPSRLTIKVAAAAPLLLIFPPVDEAEPIKSFRYTPTLKKNISEPEESRRTLRYGGKYQQQQYQLLDDNVQLIFTSPEEATSAQQHHPN
jgi:hypothetical protein